MGARLIAAGLLASLALVAAGVAVAAPGDLDTSFNGDGSRELSSTNGSVFPNAVALQADGRIVVAGTINTPNDGSRMFVKRLLSNGADDPSFAGGGFAEASFSQGATGNALMLQDGKIVVVGQSTENKDFAIARFNDDGSPDMTFDGDGRQTLGYGSNTDDTATAVLPEPGGKIVVIGQAGSGQDFAATRLDESGAVDTTFGDTHAGTTGIVFNPNGKETVAGAALTPDNKIVIVGSSYETNSNAAIARLDSEGVPDPSFGQDGHEFMAGAWAGAALPLPGGKTIVVGSGGSSDSDIYVTRLAAGGGSDSGFGATGTVKLDFGHYDFASAAALLPDGRILVAGRELSTGSRLLFARLHPDGTGDSSFGPAGQRTLPGSKTADPTGVALQPDGASVFSGWLSYMSVTGFVLRLQGDPAQPGGGSPGGGSPGGGTPGGGTPGGTTGGTGGAPLRCGGKVATIVGTAGKNTLHGTKKADVIAGLGGNDTITGAKGNDVICGGLGNDKIDGGAGKDRIYGEKGNDKLTGGVGNDTLVGGAGKDQLAGGAGKDDCSGNAGKDKASACETKHSL